MVDAIGLSDDDVKELMGKKPNVFYACACAQENFDPLWLNDDPDLGGFGGWVRSGPGSPGENRPHFIVAPASAIFDISQVNQSVLS